MVLCCSGRSNGGRPYDYDRGFNQGKAALITGLIVVYSCVVWAISCTLLLSGGRGRYGDGPYNCNGGDGGE